MAFTIRREQPGDTPLIGIVHRAAFPTDAEARLVDRLRDGEKAIVSLVAEMDTQLVGHIMFSPVSVVGHSTNQRGLGLAPVAVLPDNQGRGLGAALVQTGLISSRDEGYGFVAVLGEPAYYGRFGFRRASKLGISNEYEADEAFMVIEFEANALPPSGTLIKYAPEFAELSP